MQSARISDSEWQVMNVLWSEAPLTCREIVNRVREHKGWQKRTIRTLLDRLVDKGAIKADTERRPALYYSRLDREECIQSESQSFLNRVFAGEPASMLLHLVKNTKLDPSDIKQLKKMLSDKEK